MSVSEDVITLSHGSGGLVSRELINNVFVKKFSNAALSRLDDFANVGKVGGNLIFTTDSYVIDPIFFPGGDIGKLSVCGTINDICMSGAIPLFISVGLIIEEGFLIEDLLKISRSMAATARRSGVRIVCGDTKVVDRGKADKIFINTAGIGKIDGSPIYGSGAMPGDAVIVSGFVGDHGVSILSRRSGLEFSTSLKSDCAALDGLVKDIIEFKNDIHAMRDPTRGGIATLLNEVAKQSGVSVFIDEKDIPIRDEVNAACEMLGLDPLYLANEGKLVVFADKRVATEVLSLMRKNKLGKDAANIGEVTDMIPPRVYCRTQLGTTRLLDMLSGEQFPRIC